MLRLLRQTIPAALLLTFLSAVAAPPALADAHPHYSRLLRQGVFALEQGDAEEAVRELELACFGFLEEPPLLAECLAHLALAQAGAGDDQAFRETFGRLVEIEERFGAYAAAELPAGLRAELEGAISRRIAPRTLRYSGPFARLAEEPASRGEASAPGEAGDASPRVPAPTAAPPRAEAPESGGALERDPERPDPERLDPDERDRLDRARELLGEAVTRDDLEEPYRLAREVAEAHPGSRRAQHLTAVIAYRSSRWKEAVRHFRRGGELAADDAEGLFYFAVSLYETGERDEAADVLRRSLPGLEETPFVRSYREKILGPPAAGGEGNAGAEQSGPAGRGGSG